MVFQPNCPSAMVLLFQYFTTLFASAGNVCFAKVMTDAKASYLYKNKGDKEDFSSYTAI